MPKRHSSSVVPEVRPLAVIMPSVPQDQRAGSSTTECQVHLHTAALQETYFAGLEGEEQT